ncbi:uncharacterized protein LOC143891145 [Tasmannia lanceolata]|uniref:uncharacterized protein LOC143891145 n=1 Tax=Tasmannia lanceolata TaxID=3420 RepID=UPI004063BB28
MEEVSELLINKMWGRLNRQWVAMKARGSAGGIIVIWTENPFTMEANDIDRLIVGGDFNTIRYPEEKNVVGRVTTSMRRLSDFILGGELIDLLLEGARYTWTNNQENLILSWLDRILISTEWEEKFPRIFQRALPRPISDHNLLLLELSDFSAGPRPFKMDMSWCEDKGFDGKVKNWWEAMNVTGWKGFILGQKIKQLKLNIREWVKQENSSRELRKSEILLKLQELDRLEESNPLGNVERQQRADLKIEYEEYIRRDEISWRQKSRAIWLKEGDGNTKFFHRMANAR